MSLFPITGSDHRCDSQETIPDVNLKGSTVTVSQTAIFKAWIKYQISKNNVVAYDNITNTSVPAGLLIGLGLIPAIIIAGKLLLKRGAYYSDLEPAFNAFV